MVHLQAERVFVLEHYFTSKSFTALRDTFSGAYLETEVANKAAVK
jgi:hypothetical protein